MKRFVLAVNVAALFATPLAALDQAALERAKQDETVCYLLKASNFDDKTSDPKIAGRMIMAACTAKRMATIRAKVSDTMSDETVFIMLEKQRERDLDLASAIILITREEETKARKNKP